MVGGHIYRNNNRKINLISIYKFISFCKRILNKITSCAWLLINSLIPHYALGSRGFYMKLRSLSFVLAFVGSVLFSASASFLIPSVSDAQEWLNRTYTSNPTFMFKPMPINGVAGTNTFNSFVHALQIELGVTPEQADSGRASLW